MSKEITLINQDSGYLMIDIANAYAKSGYKVNLLTGRLVERNTPLHTGIKLDKICRYRRSNIPIRLHSWFWGTLQIIFKVWFKYKNSHLFIVSNPPLAPLVPMVCKNAFSLLIYDVYIEKPKELPVIRRLSFLTGLWIKAHKKVLKRAEKIYTLTEGMKNILEKYSNGKAVDIVPIWTDSEFLKPIPQDKNPFIKKHQLEGEFIVLYSGNIGTSSGVESLIQVASQVNDRKIKFVIIGDGARKSSIIDKIQKLELNNCLVLPWQEVSVLPYSLASANLAVVSLAARSSKSAIPSKLFNYMSVGAPILGLADMDSDLSKLIESQGIGKCFTPDSSSEIADYINYLANNNTECKSLSSRSLLTSKNYTSQNADLFLA
jgi:glycosyltransferase involved in cell wall biosynthesis